MKDYPSGTIPPSRCCGNCLLGSLDLRHAQSFAQARGSHTRPLRAPSIDPPNYIFQEASRPSSSLVCSPPPRLHFPERIAAPTVLGILSLTLLLFPESFAAHGDYYLSQEPR